MTFSRQFIETLSASGVTSFFGVPDSLMSSFSQALSDLSNTSQCRIKHIITANEGSAVGMAIGSYLATSQPACVYMQNSGIGNAINPLISLASKDVYGIPMILLIGWRGEMMLNNIQKSDEPQHIVQGRITLQQLNLLEIPYLVLEGNDNEDDLIKKLVILSRTESKPVALIARKNYFPSAVNGVNSTPVGYGMYRTDAISIALTCVPKGSAIVATTGHISRICHDMLTTEWASKDIPLFMSIGGMGHSISIAQAYAMQKKSKLVFCFDGDGSALMHLGAQANSFIAPNLFHIIFNNGCHYSVGGQETRGHSCDFANIANSLGYIRSCTIDSQDKLELALRNLSLDGGPTLVNVICSKEDVITNLPRPDRTSAFYKMKFMGYSSNEY